MKRTTSLIIAGTFAIGLSAQVNKISHGPYLQNPTTNSMSVFFTTSELSFSWVEVRGGQWDKAHTFYSILDGLREAYVRDYHIDLTDLEPATPYQYRIVSVKMNQFKTYDIRMGDTISTDWQTFRTVDPKKEQFSFLVYNDGHDNSEKLAREFLQFPVEEADFVVFNGDMISECEEPSQPYEGFIDLAVERFASTTPFLFVRGNHETRSKMARQFHNYVGRPNDRFYNIFYYGTTAFVILDAGEDKPDNTKVYAGLNDFTSYRTQQTEWLKDVLATKQFRKAKHKVVIMHMPPSDDPDSPRNESYGSQQIRREWLPLLNKAGIELMLCGHYHRYQYFQKGEDGNNFPIIVNDNHSAMRVNVSGNAIQVSIKNESGKVLLDTIFTD